ncbi:hypothetical protein Misp01_83780 [Microtetraspora sp. NBRC 13810]|uniref:hypothetical protein n=1 Tax=Microtetraspora sp. NBRC 13810 TaxID=3030990 RepID=UPI0024A5CF77|nr:hypothetical protein [Microtetraspora sp. NBRC 13810]GLW13250.1 hypothetical protein Misp01_83780 [Microtetraspora sp. NBRC 13810]
MLFAMRKARRAAVIMAVILSVTTISPPAIAASNEDPEVSASAPPASDMGTAPPQAVDEPSTATARNQDQCSEFKRKRAELLAQGHTQWACVEEKAPSTTKEQSPSAMQVPPAWCTSQWLVTRLLMCKKKEWLVTISDVQTGAVTGELLFRLTNYSYTSRDQLHWAHQTSVVFINAVGKGFGTNVSGTAGCSGPQPGQVPSCNVSAPASFPATNMNPRFPVEAEAFFDSTQVSPTGTGQIGFARTHWNYTLTNPQWPNSIVFSEVSPIVRCDNALPGSNVGRGCIVSDYIPQVDYSLTGQYPELARHIADAQASGLPGAYPAGPPLMGATGSADRADSVPGSRE